MRVLVIHNYYIHKGGEDLSTIAEIRLLRSEGHEVLEYFRENGEILDYSLFNKGALLWRAAWSRRSYDDVLRILRTRRPDVVHCHNLRHVVTPSVYDACRSEGVPVVQSLHNFSLLCVMAEFLRHGKVCEECVVKGPYHGVRHGCFRGSRIQSFAAARVVARGNKSGAWRDKVDLFTVPSEFAREKYALSGRIALDKMRILPNVVDDPGPAGDSFPMKGALYVGRMAKEKGLSVLVDAWEILAARGLKIPLTLVGEGPMRISLEERVRKAAIPCVRFEGWQEGPALQQCFRSASFVIQPSLSYETFGRVVIEAYACGRPVIVSRVGALPGLVRQGLTGLLTEPGNSFSIAEAVQRLAGDSAAIEQMGREARRAYEAQYRPERTLAALEAVYAEAMRCGSGNVN